MQSRPRLFEFVLPLFVALLTAGWMGASPAGATSIIGVDVGNGTPPTNWNQIISDGTIFNAIDETGAATDVDIAFDLGGNNINQAINAGTLPNHTPSLAGLDEFDVFAASVTFSDLVPSAQYDLWIFSVYDVVFGASSFRATVSHAGGSFPIDFNMTVAGDLVINGVTGVAGDPFCCALENWSYAFQATAGGTIDVSFANTGGSEIPLAGVAIQRIPEPTTALLLACGLAGLADLPAWRNRSARWHPPASILGLDASSSSSDSLATFSPTRNHLLA
jgi:hypothetical protein